MRPGSVRLGAMWLVAVWFAPASTRAAPDEPPASIARRCAGEPAAGRSLCLAEAAKAAGLFEQAASWYEAHAAQGPAAASSTPAALEEATALRALLGQPDQARRDLAALERTRASAEHKRRVRLALSARLAAQGAAAEARALLASASAHGATGAQALDAMAQRARLHLASGERAAAEQAYLGLVLRSNPRLLSRPRRSPGDPDAPLLALLTPPAHAPELTPAALVAEALFVLAERGRREAEALRAPVYRGPAERKAIVRFLTERAGPWLDARRAVVERAEGEFLRVLAVEPAPPPRWAIAAARRMGDLWASLVDEFRALPLPPWTAPPGLQATYYSMLDPIDEVFKMRAKQAFAFCLDHAARHGHHDEHVDACGAWLSRRYRAEYPDPEGYHLAPTLDSPGPLPPAPWPGAGGR